MKKDKKIKHPEITGPRTRKEYKEYIKADLEEAYGKFSFGKFLRLYFLWEGYRFTVWMRRTTRWYLKPKIFAPIYAFCRMMYKHYAHKYSFDISYKANIGPGLVIAHFGTIIVPSNTTIGKNCRLRPGVCIGKRLSKDSKGAVIGNNVNFGVGSKVIGEVTIGDNVIVGANAVITHDVPSDCIVAGVPARVIKHTGKKEELAENTAAEVEN